MADTPTYLATYTMINDWMRENDRAAQVCYLRLTKTGKVTATDNAGKATRFSSEGEALAAIERRRAHYDALATRYGNRDGLTITFKAKLVA